MAEHPIAGVGLMFSFWFEGSYGLGVGGMHSVMVTVLVLLCDSMTQATLDTIKHSVGGWLTVSED